MSVEYRTYTDEFLPAIVRYWNRSFADRRNFFAAAEEEFRRRVVRREQFDPALYLMALEGGEVVGAIHAAIRSERSCRALSPDWPGGTQGTIAYLHVSPARRRCGIGTELWRRIHSSLKAVRQVALSPHPFYGDGGGRIRPFWGTPMGIAVEWNDSSTKKFFARRGYAPRYKAVTLEAALEATPAPVAGEDPDRASGSRKGSKISWVALEPGRWAIVCPEDQRKGVDRRSLATALERMRRAGAKRCEVLAIPEIEGAALRIYREAGFHSVAGWAIY